MVAATSASVTAGAPSPTLRVIGTGFGRTGTLSLREALVRLGFGPCDHMLENIEHPGRFALWRDAFEQKHAGEPIDWRPLLSSYRAIVDWPGAYFWRELVAAHPEAKVILTVRDPERWYESARATIFQMRARVDASPWAALVLKLLGFALPPLRQGFRVVNDIIWDGTFGARFADRDHALRVFAAHNRAVREGVPPELLLVFDVKQGWDPLCAFLGVPVPAGPFPHVNDAVSFQRLIQEQFARRLLRSGAAVIAGFAVVVTSGMLVRRFLSRRAQERGRAEAVA
jgi:hypothetical protein